MHSEAVWEFYNVYNDFKGIFNFFIQKDVTNNVHIFVIHMEHYMTNKLNKKISFFHQNTLCA